MSKFFSKKYEALTPYTPGEQPRERKYIKLNTNESPFPPSPTAVEAATRAAGSLQLYSDPTAKLLHEKIAALYGVEPECVLATNGSDEILNFAFMAFCDREHPAIFPDITYGFYSVFAQLNGVPYEEIPLREDLTVDIADYTGKGKTVFIANPNAPTGIALTLAEVERIVASNPTSVVVIDEAYVDFGGESAAGLTKKYRNLLVTGTFSKSRSMAGARLGFGIACPEHIRDLNTVKYSTNPYNVNSMTMAAGVATLEDEAYTKKNCMTVMENRAFLMEELTKRGFTLTDSKANFLFVAHPDFGGEALYLALKEKGILVRHFKKARIENYLRITVGAKGECVALLSALDEIMT